MQGRRDLTIITGAFFAAFIWSGIAPNERHTWWLEVTPVLLVVPLLWLTHKRFPLTTLLTYLIGFHTLVLCYGGKYTYAQTPLGYWVQDLFDFSRNHYDRFGHFVQGFVPAIAAREILLRTSPLRRGKWLFFLVCCVALAISAFYELIEWWAALLFGDDAHAFLGTQGDIWDSHADMFWCLIGALIAQLTLARVHDKQLAKLA